MSPYRNSFYPLLILTAAALLLLLIALPAANGPLVLDSTKLHSLTELVSEYGEYAVFHTPDFGVGLQRVVSMFSFVLNLQINESLSPFQLKLTNIFIHAVCGALIFFFVKTLLLQSQYHEKAASIALITSLLWLTSPINFNTSIYTIQRMTQLSTLFTLLGLFLYTRGRLRNKGWMAYTYITASILVCLPLAALSKENGVLLVAFLFLLEIYFLNVTQPSRIRYVVLLATIGVIASTGILINQFPGAIDYGHRDFTLIERLLSQTRVIMLYLQEIIFPYTNDIGVFTDDFKKSTSLLSPITTLFSTLGLVAGLMLCTFGNRAHTKLAAFGFAFFLVGHSIESSFLSLELYFPHRNYLPSLGIYLIASWLLVTVLPSKKWLITIIAIALIYFSAISYARSITWSSRENIILTSVYYHPDSPRALSNYAQLALEKRNFNLAFAAINKSISLSNALNSHLQRLYILCDAGSAIDSNTYQQLGSTDGLGVHNELSQALTNLLSLYRTGRCNRLDIEQFVAALDSISAAHEQKRLAPWVIEYYTVNFLYYSGKKPLAHDRLQSRLDRGHTESGLYRLQLLIEEKRIEEANKIIVQIENQIKLNDEPRFEPVLGDFILQLKKLEKQTLQLM